jgi:hypothetical protein
MTVTQEAFDKSAPIDLSVIRNDWTRDEVESLFQMPLMDLVFRAQTIHRAFHDPNSVQLSTLLNTARNPPATKRTLKTKSSWTPVACWSLPDKPKPTVPVGSVWGRHGAT